MADIVESFDQAEADDLKRRTDNYMKLISGGFSRLGARSRKAEAALSVSRAQSATKTGIYARIPIYCKEEGCPYSENCLLLQQGLAPKGEMCPTEIAQIERKYLNYEQDFQLDKEDASYTDLALVEEIITAEIMMERCKALLSKEQSPIQEIAVGVAENGSPIVRPDISPTMVAYEKWSSIRNKDYDLMMATRKNKSKFQETKQEKSILDIVDELQSEPGFYDIEQRPENLETEGFSVTQK